MQHGDLRITTINTSQSTQHSLLLIQLPERNRNYTLMGVCKRQQTTRKTWFLETPSAPRDCQLQMQPWGLSIFENTTVLITYVTDVDASSHSSEESCLQQAEPEDQPRAHHPLPPLSGLCGAHTHRGLWTGLRVTRLTSSLLRYPSWKMDVISLIAYLVVAPGIQANLFRRTLVSLRSTELHHANLHSKTRGDFLKNAAYTGWDNPVKLLLITSETLSRGFSESYTNSPSLFIIISTGKKIFSEVFLAISPSKKAREQGELQHWQFHPLASQAS